MYNDAYSSIQGYLKVNGYPIASKLDDCSEQNEVDELTHERIYHVIAPITVFGKLVNPTEFEKINVIKKISLKITER